MPEGEGRFDSSTYEAAKRQIEWIDTPDKTKSFVAIDARIKESRIKEQKERSGEQEVIQKTLPWKFNELLWIDLKMTEWRGSSQVVRSNLADNANISQKASLIEGLIGIWKGWLSSKLEKWGLQKSPDSNQVNSQTPVISIESSTLDTTNQDMKMPTQEIVSIGIWANTSTESTEPKENKEESEKNELMAKLKEMKLTYKNKDQYVDFTKIALERNNEGNYIVKFDDPKFQKIKTPIIMDKDGKILTQEVSVDIWRFIPNLNFKLKQDGKTINIA